MELVSEQGTNGRGPEAVGDPVDAVVERVRAELAERRRRGELPQLPADEVVRQFEGVVEAVDAGLVEEPPLATDGLMEAARLPTWRPHPVGNPVRRVLALLLRFPSRAVGLVVRRQVEDFSHRSGALVQELAQRQNRVTDFLARAHLDRIRSLEYRVAQLEEELVRLRDDAAGGRGRS